MCGIGGIVYKCGGMRFGKFSKSFELASHRGPDNTSEYINHNIGLFHHRLSILDLSKASNQPFTLDMEDYMVYNGELYNYKEIAQEERLSLKTTSDTEVLMQVFGEFGTQILPKLNGVFAFAYLSTRDNTLTLVRDRLGVKPLYYVDTPDFFAFSSEAKVLYDYLDVMTLNWATLSEFLWFGSSISNSSICDEVKKVEPGSSVILDLNSYSISLKRFWSINEHIVPRGINAVGYQEAKSEVDRLLNVGIERQCMSDVPVGAYLSGGVDSSLVVALASKYTGGKLKTFSASFEGSNNSELPLAKKVSEKFGTEHYEIEVTTRGLEDEIKNIIFQYDEPFADPAAIPLHLLASRCKNESKVILQGDGGDELFGGYGRHIDMSQLKMRQIASATLQYIHPSSSYREVMLDKTRRLNVSPFWKKMALSVSHTTRIPVKDMFNRYVYEQLEKSDPFRRYKNVDVGLSNLDSLTRMLYTDMQIILPNTFMDKVDKINMYHSIEARVPLLDNDLVDYALRLPPEFKVKGRKTKRILRDVAQGILPSEILNAKKVSFGTPMGEWLKTILYDFAMDVFNNSRKMKVQLMNQEYLVSLLNDHKRGASDNSNILWRSMVLLIWLEFYDDKIRVE